MAYQRPQTRCGVCCSEELSNCSTETRTRQDFASLSRRVHLNQFQVCKALAQGDHDWPLALQQLNRLLQCRNVTCIGSESKSKPVVHGLTMKTDALTSIFASASCREAFGTSRHGSDLLPDSVRGPAIEGRHPFLEPPLETPGTLLGPPLALFPPFLWAGPAEAARKRLQ